MDNVDQPIAPDASKVADDAREVVPAFGLGRFAPFNWERTPHATGVRVLWGRSAAWLVVLICIGWLALAVGAYGFVKYRRGFTDVSFQHMLLLPWKRDDYRRAKGEFLIKQGLELAEKQEWRPAFGLLRTGLAAVPDHREARLMTARIYLMAGRPDMVRTLLIDGLAYHGDQLDYVRQVLGFFFGLQADEAVVTLTSELRSRLDAASPGHRLAVTALAYAYFNRDRLDDALRVLSDERLLATPEGRFVTARVAWERGRREDALGQLRELTAQVPDDYEIYRTLVYYLNEDRRWGDVRRAALSRQFALPDQPEAYIDFIAACVAEGDEAARVAAEAAFFERFGRDSLALIKLSEDAALTGRIEMSRRVLARCRELGREEINAVLLLMQAQVVRRDYDGLQAVWADLRPGVSRWPERQQLVLSGLRAVALYGQRQEVEAEPLVQKLCETRLLPAQNLTALARQLEQVGRRAEARRVLRHAVEIDPLSQPALALLLRSLLADNQLDETPVLIERLLGMRKPPLDLMTDLARVFESDLYVFQPQRARTLALIRDWLRMQQRSVR
jgi:tetratricopeptide (TPR) repeat protein